MSSEIENLQGQIAKLQAEVNRLSGQVAEPTRAMYYPDADLAVWLVPKNAHSSLQAYLMDLGFARSLGSYIPDSARNLAIVRDPVERYVSSLWNSYGNTTLRNLNNPPVPGIHNANWEQFLEVVLDYNQKFGEEKGVWTHWNDNHYAPQTRFIPQDRKVELIDIHDLDTLPDRLIEYGVGLDPLMPQVRETEMPHKMAANQSDKDHALSRITDDDAWLIIRSYQKDWNMWVAGLDAQR